MSLTRKQKFLSLLGLVVTLYIWVGGWRTSPPLPPLNDDIVGTFIDQVLVQWRSLSTGIDQNTLKVVSRFSPQSDGLIFEGNFQLLHPQHSLQTLSHLQQGYIFTWKLNGETQEAEGRLTVRPDQLNHSLIWMITHEVNRNQSTWSITRTVDSLPPLPEEEWPILLESSLNSFCATYQNSIEIPQVIDLLNGARSGPIKLYCNRQNEIIGDSLLSRIQFKRNHQGKLEWITQLKTVEGLIKDRPLWDNKWIKGSTVEWPQSGAHGIIELSKIPVQGKIPLQANWITWRLSGVFVSPPNTQRQKVIHQDASLGEYVIQIKKGMLGPSVSHSIVPLQRDTALCSHLNRQIYTPSFYQLIQELKQSSMHRTPKDLSQKVISWLEDHIEITIRGGPPNPLQTLQRGDGDCNEQSLLYASLMCALNIEVQLVYGIVATSSSSMGYHAWAQYWDGTQWVEVDPLWRRQTVSAHHIALSKGEATAQSILKSVIGRINLKLIQWN